MLFKKVGILDPEGKYPNPLTGRPFTERYKHIAETGSPNVKGSNPGNGWAHSTIYKDRNNFFKNAIENQVIIVVSGTGTGKTVMFPKLLSHYFDYKKSIIITMPTRKAVGGAATYAAMCMDVEYKKEVAMRTGEDDHEDDPENTKLLYATDGFVSGLISSDEYLERFHGILIDEVHTRGTNIDILLRKVTEIAKVRKDFRIVVMSATIDPKPFIDYFNLHNLSNVLMEYTGKKSNFPVKDVFYHKELPLMQIQGKDYIEKINQLLLETDGENILAFVTAESQGESLKKKIMTIIEKDIDKYKDVPWIGVLGGKTQEEEKNKCLGNTPTHEIKPGKYGPYKRRLIFATNAIEFSVTFGDTLNYVIDNGIKFSVTYNYELNCTVLGNAFVQQSNIHQRCGRTGRKAPGTCYRMYTKQKYDAFGKFEPPAILKEDIHNVIINLMSMKTIGTFKKCNEYLDSMLTPVPQTTKKVIFSSLLEHNLMNTKGELTKIGKFLSIVPLNVDFNLKKMLLVAYYFNCLAEIMVLIAVLQNTKNLGEIFNNRVPDTFEGNYQEKQREETIIKAKNLKKFAHSSGDHITLIKLYMKLITIDEDEKELYCKENNINYNTIKRIDETYYDLYLNWDDDNKMNIHKIFPLIIYGNFFNVPNHPTLSNRKTKIANLLMLKPKMFEMRGGSNKYDFKKLQKQIKVKSRSHKKKKKQFDKKKSFKKQNNYPLPIKKNKEELYSILNKINLINQSEEKIIELSDDTVDNILACVVYSNITNLGIRSDNETGYLLKNRKDVDVNIYSSTTVLNLYKNPSDFIVFNKLNLSNNQFSIDFVSKINKKIINMVLDKKIN
jgi:HrpA-like RNA helicase